MTARQASSGSKVPAASRNGGKPKRVKKLELGCGKNKQQGFFGLDISPDSDADLLCDLFEPPWPIASNCVEAAFSAHLVEHIPHWRPGWERDGWFRFFDELYRVMKKGGVAEIIHPYVMSTRAFWDPTHLRFIHEMTWYYLNAEWRKGNRLDHYPVSCDFEVVTIDATGLSDEFMSRAAEQQAFSRNHYWNVIADLRVILKKQ